MLFFAERVTIPLIRETNKKKILEIGSSFGNSIRPILSLGDVEVSIIDPCIDTDLSREFGSRITLYKGLSLDILPHISSSFDCIFIDGDHNWYTVFNELKLIEDRQLLRPGGLIFLHDIGWPYGRRDLYYEPEHIPREHRKDYAKRGIERGRSTLLPEGGFNAGHYNAIEENGPRNGVLTAVEDYLKQSRQKFYFVKDPREFGFGILLRQSAENDWRRAVRLRLRIFRQIHVDPTLASWSQTATLLRASRPARVAKRLRNSVFRRYR